MVGLGLLILAGLVSFWPAWFAFPTLLHAIFPGDPRYEIYYNFERAFLLADSWFALATLIGVIGLYREKEYGVRFALVSAGCAIFLSLLDLLFGLQQGILVPFSRTSLSLWLIIIFLSLYGTLIIYLAGRLPSSRSG